MNFPIDEDLQLDQLKFHANTEMTCRDWSPDLTERLQTDTNEMFCPNDLQCILSFQGVDGTDDTSSKTKVNISSTSIRSCDIFSKSSISFASKKKHEQQRSTMSNGPMSLLSKQVVPDVNEILQNCIDVIWQKYDDDGNGYLDKDECFAFILESIQGFGFETSRSDDNTMEEEYKQVFDRKYSLIDENGDGVISKEEMLSFVKELVGL